MVLCRNKVTIVLLRSPEKSILISGKDYAVGSVVAIPLRQRPLANHIPCGTEMIPSLNWYFCSHECLTKHVW